MMNPRRAISALLLLLLPCAALCAPAAASTDDSTVFESLRTLPRGWTYSRPAQPDVDSVALRISLKQQNLDAFYAGLLQVSTPGHARYGQHYSAHELRSLLRPAAAATAAAVRWLRDADGNITEVRDEGDYVFFRAPVAAAERLLAARFAWYRHAASGEELLRTTRYSLPPAVAAHVNFVQPTTRFGGARPLASRADVVAGGELAVTGESKWVAAGAAVGDDVKVAAAGAAGAAGAGGGKTAVDPSCADKVTPQCLFQLYNINVKGSSASNNVVGYASFVGQSARFTDQAMFSQTYAPFAVGRNFTVMTLNGGVNDQTSGSDAGEANLDQQYILATGFDVPVVEVITGGLGQLVPDGASPTLAGNTNEPFLDFAMGLVAMPDAQIPNSISISYGENEQEIPPAYAAQVCNLFAQLGARGKTILVASGDSGVGDFCQANDGTNATRFQPQFPGSCPFVTSVGGTQGIAPETATFFSSGGFSNMWARPAYQDAAVTGYLQKVGANFTGLFNATGRATPDIAAQSVNFRVINGGRDQALRGTSASAPVVNGIVGLLNSARIAAGMPTMGFLNPFLYGAAASAMNDITAGSSSGCDGLTRFKGKPNGSPVVKNAGFAATEGWDAVTGLGTPDFSKLLALAAPGAKNEGGVLSTSAPPAAPPAPPAAPAA